MGAIEMLSEPNRKRQVAVVYSLDHPGGVQSCAFAIIRGLNRQGITPEVLWDVAPNWKYLNQLGLKVTFHPIRFTVPSTLINRMPVSLRYLAWALNGVHASKLDKKHDFYFIFYNGFYPPDDAPHLRYLSGPPLIPALKSFRPGLRGFPGRFSDWFYDHVLGHFSSVHQYHRDSVYVINSGFTADLFKKEHGVQLPVIYPPVNLSGRHFDFSDLLQRSQITFFSRIIDYKRPEKVLELAANYPEKPFLIMGAVPSVRESYYETLKEKAAAQGLRNVRFLANPSDERVKEELAQTRFYVFPAVNEHFGITTVEAIASGVIPFVHDSGGQREIVTNPEMRFTDDYFLDKFADLVDRSDEALNQERQKLFRHIQQFSEENYIARMLSFIPRSTPSYRVEGAQQPA